jgi:uncharacterized protein
MTTPKRFLPLLAAVITALAAGVLLTAALTPPAQAQDEPEEPAAQTESAETRSITVQGQSSISATPDRATIRLGVVTQAPTATAALADNATLMQDVISATLGLDIPEDQVRTQTVQLYPVYSSSPPIDVDTAAQAQEPQITGYRATNVVAVTVDDVALVAELLDAATAAGANNVEGISFEIADRADLLAEARREAMRDARLRAETYLEETGDALGTVLTIRELGTSQPFPVARDEVFAVGGAGVPIQPGQQTVDVTVEVTWSLTAGE